MSPTSILVIQAIASAITAVALVVLVAAAARVAWHFRITHRKVNELLDRLHGEITPISRHVTSIADDLRAVTASIRGDVERVNTTIADANDRVQQAVALTEKRVNEFNALLAVVQHEAEHVFLDTASTVRAFRRGAAAFAGEMSGSGMDLASDELDAAGDEEVDEESAEELETRLASEEESDGDDGSPEPAAEAFPAAPRLRPRARNRRRA